MWVIIILGQLMDMKGLVVTSVALGKAHCAMLTNRGNVYTFGPNNKGQCGRDFTSKERTSLCLCVCLSVCLTVSVCLCICLCICLSVWACYKVIFCHCIKIFLICSKFLYYD